MPDATLPPEPIAETLAALWSPLLAITTHHQGRSSRVFALHTLPAAPNDALTVSLSLVHTLGMRSGHDGDRMAGIAMRSGVTGCPILAETLTYVEARVVSTLGAEELTARAGAPVAVTGRTAGLLAETVDMVKRAGGRALAVPGDVSAPDAVALVVRTTESHLGPVDILVNNAGVVGPLGNDWEVAPEDWWRTFEINVRGPFLYARAVSPGVVRRQRGRIVNVSSTPIDRCAQMLLFLVSGRADALSGRFIRAQDNEEDLVHRAEEIRRDDLHTVTLRT